MQRFAWFDSLRCAAVLLVIFHHSPDISSELPFGISTLFSQIHLIGWVGVDLFFVLSGFLVSGLLFDEYDATGTLDIRRFLIRRGFKIIPAFYVLTAVTALYQFCFQGGVFKRFLLDDLCFLQSYLPGSWPHAWTLAVEVHFYITLALLLAYLSRRGTATWLKPLPWILGGILAVDFLVRMVHFGSAVTDINIQKTHLHLDVLAAGVLLRYLYNYHPEALVILERRKLYWICGSLILLYPSELLHVPHPFYMTALLPTFNWIAFFVILFQATLIPFPGSVAMKWLVGPFDYLGKHSYSIYLWHIPIKIWIIDRFIPEPGWLNVLCFFAGSLIVGTFFSEVLEMPVLHLRNRLFPSKSQRRRPAADREAGPGLKT
ncbi:MAG TPA: acyltransferase [Candidatus Methylacidiphilales bacterium]|jgi:peptidoglycan/LPS O-acetylase OafA/YrhL|nr:acyltransferase [Candidatus Methylacidiphilales bacterium]